MQRYLYVMSNQNVAFAYSSVGLTARTHA
jgi:hypothetical protein